MMDYISKNRKERFECGELAYYTGEEIRAIINNGSDNTGFSFLETLVNRLSELAIPKEDNARGHSNINPEVFRGLCINIMNHKEKYLRKMIVYKMHARMFLKRLEDIYENKGIGGGNKNKKDLEEMQDFCYNLSERLLCKEQQWFFY